MFNAFQVIALTVLMFCISWDTNNTQVTVYGRTTLSGFLAGIIVGDIGVGLMTGATLELMSLGIDNYGGASVPNYNVGAIVGTAFAVATCGGLEAGLAIGIPTAVLGVQLDVLAKMTGSFFLHRAQAAAEELNTKKMYFWILAGGMPRPLIFALTTFIAVTAGASAIEGILNSLPVWIVSGLTVAGNVLPAVGIAILLRYMPFKKYFVYVLLGFVFASYFGLPMIGIAILGFVAAFLTFQSSQNNDAVAPSGPVPTSGEGDFYDE